MPGAVPGQTSSTGQGAWSTTKRVAGPRLRGPSREWSPGEDEQVGVVGGGDDLVFGGAVPLLAPTSHGEDLYRRIFAS